MGRGKARAAAQSPDPPKKRPADAGTFRTGSDVNVRTHVDGSDFSRPHTKITRWSHGPRHPPADGRHDLPRTRLRLPHADRRGRDATNAVHVVLHEASRGRAGARDGGSRRSNSTGSHRAPPRQGDASLRSGARPVGSTIVRFQSRHMGFNTFRIGTSRTWLAAGQTPAAFLDHTAARAGAHRHRRSDPGHGPPSLIAYRAQRPPRARRVPRVPKTARKKPCPSAEGSLGTHPRGGLRPYVARGVRGTRRLTSPVPSSAVRPVPVSTEHHYPYKCAQFGAGRHTPQAPGQPG